MPDEIGRLVAKYASRGIIVDTNVLLLLLVGLLDRQLLRTFKRTNQYIPDDFDLLVQFLRQFHRLVATPHILTEVGNLGGQLKATARADFFRLLADFVTTIDEQSLPTREFPAVGEHLFPRLGVTDSLTILVARQNLPVLSDDFDLVQALHAAGVEAINFNHLREF